MKKQKPSVFVSILTLIGALIVTAASLGATAWLLRGMVSHVGQPKKVQLQGGGHYELTDRMHMHVTNTISDALEGALAIKKVYWIGDNELVAPKPNPACFGQTDDPSTLQWLLDDSAELLEGQSLFFSTETEILPGSVVHYYKDDTILAITWKQVMDYMVFTFTEVKVAHPSQFRRGLAGGEFGSEKTFVTTEMARSVNAVAASSGDYYRFRNVGVVVYDGIVRRVNNGLTDTCYIDRNGDMHFSYVSDRWDMESAQKYVDDNDIRFSLVFGPAIIENREIRVPARYSLGEINDNYPRAALCQMDRLHYVVGMVNSERWYTYEPTMDQFAWQISKTGCLHAYALDGGQTASTVFNGELINSVMYGYQRWHSDILYFATAIPSDES